MEKDYPEKCPITGNRYWGHIENEDGEFVPVYGGPFDSYTIPIPVDNEPGYYVTQRFCQDRGQWMGDVSIEPEKTS